MRCKLLTRFSHLDYAALYPVEQNMGDPTTGDMDGVMTTSTQTPVLTVYEKRSVMPTTLAKMIAFHQSPAALAQLTPPPIFIQLKRDDRRSFDAGELEFVLWFGPLPIRWIARHEPGPIPSSFVDVMLVGPLDSWRHEHIFREVPGGVELLDRVTLRHKPGLAGLASRLMFDGLPLRLLFLYRHLRTRLAVR